MLNFAHIANVFSIPQIDVVHKSLYWLIYAFEVLTSISSPKLHHVLDLACRHHQVPQRGLTGNTSWII